MQRNSRGHGYAAMHRDGKMPLRSSHDADASAPAQDGPTEPQQDLFDPGNILRGVVSASGTGCAAVAEQEDGAVWKTRDHRHKAESYCILQLKERSQRDVQLQIAFSSPEAAPHTLLLLHAPSSARTFKMLGPAVHLQPHMCHNVLLTINIGAAVPVQRYLKVQLHGHLGQPHTGTHCVCRLAVTQQSAAVAEAAAAAVPLPVPPLFSPNNSTPSSPSQLQHHQQQQQQQVEARGRTAAARGSRQKFLQREEMEGDGSAWWTGSGPAQQLRASASAADGAWQSEQEGGGHDLGSPEQQHPQRWAATAAAAGVEVEAVPGSPRDDARPAGSSAQVVQPAYLDQLATVSPKGSAPWRRASWQQGQQQQQQQHQVAAVSPKGGLPQGRASWQQHQQQQWRVSGGWQVRGSGAASDQAASTDTGAAAVAAAAGLSGGHARMLPSGTQDDLLQALGCWASTDQWQQEQDHSYHQEQQQHYHQQHQDHPHHQGQQQQHYHQQHQQLVDDSLFCCRALETEAVAVAEPCQGSLPGDPDQQQLRHSSSSTQGLLQWAQAVAGAVSSSLGRLPWTSSSSRPGSPMAHPGAAARGGCGDSWPPTAAAAAGGGSGRVAPAAPQSPAAAASGGSWGPAAVGGSALGTKPSSCDAAAAVAVYEEAEQQLTKGWYRAWEETPRDDTEPCSNSSLPAAAAAAGTEAGSGQHSAVLQQVKQQRQQQQQLQEEEEQRQLRQQQQEEEEEDEQLGPLERLVACKLQEQQQQQGGLQHTRQAAPQLARYPQLSDGSEGAPSHCQLLSAAATEQEELEQGHPAVAPAVAEVCAGTPAGGAAPAYTQSCSVQVGAFSEAVAATGGDPGDAASCCGPAAAVEVLGDTASSATPGAGGGEDGRAGLKHRAAAALRRSQGLAAAKAQQLQQQQLRGARVKGAAAGASVAPVQGAAQLPKQQQQQQRLQGTQQVGRQQQGAQLAQQLGPTRLHQRPARGPQRCSSQAAAASKAAGVAAPGSAAVPADGVNAVPVAGSSGGRRSTGVGQAAPAAAAAGGARLSKQPWVAGKQQQQQQQQQQQRMQQVAPGGGAKAGDGCFSPARTSVALRVSAEGVALVPVEPAPPSRPSRYMQLLQHKYGSLSAGKKQQQQLATAQPPPPATGTAATVLAVGGDGAVGGGAVGSITLQDEPALAAAGTAAGVGAGGGAGECTTSTPGAAGVSANAADSEGAASSGGSAAGGAASSGGVHVGAAGGLWPAAGQPRAASAPPHLLHAGVLPLPPGVTHPMAAAAPASKPRAASAAAGRLPAAVGSTAQQGGGSTAYLSSGSTAHQGGGSTAYQSVSPMSSSRNGSRCNTPGRWSDKWGNGSQDGGTPRDPAVLGGGGGAGCLAQQPAAGAVGGGGFNRHAVVSGAPGVAAWVGAAAAEQAGSSRLLPAAVVGKGVGATALGDVPAALSPMPPAVVAAGMAAMQNMLFQPLPTSSSGGLALAAGAGALDAPSSSCSNADRGVATATAAAEGVLSPGGGQGLDAAAAGTAAVAGGSCSLQQGLLLSQLEATDSPVQGFISMAAAAAAAGKLPGASPAGVGSGSLQPVRSPAVVTRPEARLSQHPTAAASGAEGTPAPRAGAGSTTPSRSPDLVDLQVQQLARAARVQTPTSALFAPRGWTRRACTPDQLGLASPVTGGRAGGNQRSRVGEVEQQAGGEGSGFRLIGLLEEEDIVAEGAAQEEEAAASKRGGGGGKGGGGEGSDAEAVAAATGEEVEMASHDHSHGGAAEGGDDVLQPQLDQLQPGGSPGGQTAVEVLQPQQVEVLQPEQLLRGLQQHHGSGTSSSSIRVGIERWRPGASQAVQVEQVYCLTEEAVAQLQQEAEGDGSCAGDDSGHQQQEQLGDGVVVDRAAGQVTPAGDGSGQQQQELQLEEGVVVDRATGQSTAAVLQGVLLPAGGAPAGGDPTAAAAQIPDLERDLRTDQRDLVQPAAPATSSQYGHLEDDGDISDTTSSAAALQLPGAQDLQPRADVGRQHLLKQQQRQQHPEQQQQLQEALTSPGAGSCASSCCSGGAGGEEDSEQYPSWLRWSSAAPQAAAAAAGAGEQAQAHKQHVSSPCSSSTKHGNAVSPQQQQQQGKGVPHVQVIRHTPRRQGACIAAVAAALAARGGSTAASADAGVIDVGASPEPLQAAPTGAAGGGGVSEGQIGASAAAAASRAHAAAAPQQRLLVQEAVSESCSEQEALQLFRTRAAAAPESCSEQEALQLYCTRAAAAPESCSEQEALQLYRSRAAAAPESCSEQEALQLYRSRAAAAQQQSAVLASLHEAASKAWLGPGDPHVQQQQQVVVAGVVPPPVYQQQHAVSSSVGSPLVVPLPPQQQLLEVEGTPRPLAAHQHHPNTSPSTFLGPHYIHGALYAGDASNHQSPGHAGCSFPALAAHASVSSSTVNYASINSSSAADSQVLLREALQQLQLGLQQLPQLIEMSTGHTPMKSDPVMQVASQMASVAAAAAALTVQPAPGGLGEAAVDPEATAGGNLRLPAAVAGVVGVEREREPGSQLGAGGGISPATYCWAQSPGGPALTSPTAAGPATGPAPSSSAIAAAAAAAASAGGGEPAAPGVCAPAGLQTPPSKGTGVPPEHYERFAPLHTKLKLPLALRSSSRTPRPPQDSGELLGAASNGQLQPSPAAAGAVTGREGLAEVSRCLDSYLQDGDEAAAGSSGSSGSRAGSSPPREFGGPWARRSRGGSGGGLLLSERSAPAVLASSSWAAGSDICSSLAASGAAGGGGGWGRPDEGSATGPAGGGGGWGGREEGAAPGPAASKGPPVVPPLPLAALLGTSPPGSSQGAVSVVGYEATPAVTARLTDCMYLACNDAGWMSEDEVSASQDVSMVGSLQLLSGSEQAAAAAAGVHMDTPRILVLEPQQQQQQGQVGQQQHHYQRLTLESSGRQQHEEVGGDMGPWLAGAGAGGAGSRWHGSCGSEADSWELGGWGGEEPAPACSSGQVRPQREARAVTPAATAAAGAGGRGGSSCSPAPGEHVSLADGVAEGGCPVLDEGLLAGGGLRAGLKRLQQPPEQRQQQQWEQQQQVVVGPPPLAGSNSTSSSSSSAAKPPDGCRQPGGSSSNATARKLHQQHQQQQAPLARSGAARGAAVAAASSCSSNSRGGGTARAAAAAAAAPANNTMVVQPPQQQQQQPGPSSSTAGVAARWAAPRPLALVLPSDPVVTPGSARSGTSDVQGPSPSPRVTPPGESPAAHRGLGRPGSGLGQHYCNNLKPPTTAGPARGGAHRGRHQRHRRVRSDIPQMYPCSPLHSPLHNAMPQRLTDSTSLGALHGCDLGDEPSAMDAPLHTGLRSPAAMYRLLKGGPGHKLLQQHQQQLLLPASDQQQMPYQQHQQLLLPASDQQLVCLLPEGALYSGGGTLDGQQLAALWQQQMQG